jgi:hypothetical protein
MSDSLEHRFDGQPEPEVDRQRFPQWFVIILLAVHSISGVAGFWAQSYKTFSGRNLRFFGISYGVCNWQAIPA